MAANMQTLAAALMNDRTDRVIRNLLQNDVAGWAKIPIKGRSWSGDVSIIVLRVGRNNSVTSVLGNTEPAAGSQKFMRLTVTAKRILGKMQIDVMTMLSADDAKGSVAVEPADEMNGLLNDFQKKLSRYAFLGGGGLQGIDSLAVAGSPIGLIWQRSNAITTYGYRGRFDDIVAQAQAFNFARFIRLDTYAQVGADTLITDLTSRTIVLAANIDTSTLPAGVPCAVMLVGAVSQAFVKMKISGDNTPGDPVVLDPASDFEVGALIGDMTGYISNLTQPLHFGNDRANTSVNTRRIRSNFMVVNNTNAQGGDVLSGIEFDKFLARVRTKGSENLDALWMSFETAVAYPESLMGVADGNIRTQSDAQPKVLDPAPKANEGNDSTRSGYARGGVPIHCSVDCPDGIALGMKYTGWERLFKGPVEGVWLGQNGIGGNPLIKAEGETQYVGTRAIFPEQVCTTPLGQGILIGIADPS